MWIGGEDAWQLVRRPGEEPARSDRGEVARHVAEGLGAGEVVGGGEGAQHEAQPVRADDDADRQGGQDAQRSLGEEVAEPRALVPALRDQEAADREEDLHTEEAERGAADLRLGGRGEHEGVREEDERGGAEAQQVERVAAAAGEVRGARGVPSGAGRRSCRGTVSATRRAPSSASARMPSKRRGQAFSAMNSSRSASPAGPPASASCTAGARSSPGSTSATRGLTPVMPGSATAATGRPPARYSYSFSGLIASVIGVCDVGDQADVGGRHEAGELAPRDARADLDVGQRRERLVVGGLEQLADERDRPARVGRREPPHLVDVDTAVEAADVEHARAGAVVEPGGGDGRLEPLLGIDAVGQDRDRAGGRDALEHGVGDRADRAPARPQAGERLLVDGPPAAVRLRRRPVVPRVVGDRPGPAEVAEAGEHRVRRDDRGPLEAQAAQRRGAATARRPQRRGGRRRGRRGRRGAAAAARGGPGPGTASRAGRSQWAAALRGGLTTSARRTRGCSGSAAASRSSGMQSPRATAPLQLVWKRAKTTSVPITRLTLRRRAAFRSASLRARGSVGGAEVPWRRLQTDRTPSFPLARRPPSRTPRSRASAGCSSPAPPARCWPSPPPSAWRAWCRRPSSAAPRSRWRSSRSP